MAFSSLVGLVVCGQHQSLPWCDFGYCSYANSSQLGLHPCFDCWWNGSIQMSKSLLKWKCPKLNLIFRLSLSLPQKTKLDSLFGGFIHEVTKSRTWLSDWTELNWSLIFPSLLLTFSQILPCKYLLNMSLTIPTVIAISSQSFPIYSPQCINSKVISLECRLCRLIVTHCLNILLFIWY